MAENIEIKARIADCADTEALLQRLCGPAAARLSQQDTYYHCKRARLKIREMPDRAELIYYTRSNQSGPKVSRYFRKELPFPAVAKRLLRVFFGLRGVVKKERALFFSGRTRIHLDAVQGLGNFLELEVVLRKAESHASGEAEARVLMEQLRLSPDALVSCSYIELLEARAG